MDKIMKYEDVGANYALIELNEDGTVKAVITDKPAGVVMCKPVLPSSEVTLIEAGVSKLIGDQFPPEVPEEEPDFSALEARLARQETEEIEEVEGVQACVGVMDKTPFDEYEDEIAATKNRTPNPTKRSLQ